MARKSAQTCDPAVEQEFERGKAYEQEQAHEKAFACFSAAARGGHAGAEFCLAVCCEQGRGTERDLSQAVTHYRRAAWRGYAAAQYALGQCNADGRGIGRDEKTD